MDEHPKKRLTEALRIFCETLRSLVEKGSEIEIVAHFDADGITSGGILATALARSGARYSVRAISEMNNAIIERMAKESHDFYIITDLGGGWASKLKKNLGNNWMILDHHFITEQELLTDDTCQILNPWKYGIDGGSEISAGGVAYLVASTLDAKNKDLSAVAVVSAVADRQDTGEKKSLTGLNSEILKTAETLGLISIDQDLLLYGRETRPLHESMAFTTFPYIEGLTWKPQDCYTLLKSAGIRLKDNGRWRVPAELTEEEKSQLLNAISKFVSNSNETSAILLRELYGYTYTINGEDRCNLLREARGYATMLNACGRIGKAGVGISICMGDRNEMLTIGEQITETYMNTLRNCISTLFAGKWRIMDDGKNVFINGEGVIPEDMLGAVSSLLSGSLSFNGRLLFVRTLAGDGSYKFSSRKCLGCNSNLDLGQIMRRVSYTFQGVGGGHSSAAGSKIPQTALDGFIANIKSFTSEPKVGPTSS